MSDNKKIVNTMPPDKPKREIPNPTAILFITFGAVLLVVIFGTTFNFGIKPQYYEQPVESPPEFQGLPQPQPQQPQGQPQQQQYQGPPPQQQQPQGQPQ